MSWQAYIDSSLIGSGMVDEAGIFSSNGKDIWASSPGLKVSTAEMAVILEGFTDPTPLFTSGLKIDNEKYTVFKADEQAIMGRKGKEGIIIVRTKKALILAHHPETVQTQQCANTVEGLGDYLTGVGY